MVMSVLVALKKIDHSAAFLIGIGDLMGNGFEGSIGVEAIVGVAKILTLEEDHRATGQILALMHGRNVRKHFLKFGDHLGCVFVVGMNCYDIVTFLFIGRVDKAFDVVMFEIYDDVRCVLEFALEIIQVDLERTVLEIAEVCIGLSV